MRAAWNRDTENLYSAWIEKLFDAPLDEAPSWKAMHEVLRDRSRNVLFNYLGLREDQKGLVIRPDCADVPYFLRAYFAFKMGLPFGYSKCTRGDGGQPPKCSQWWNIVNEEPPPAPPPDQMVAPPSACSPCSARRPAAAPRDAGAAAEAARPGAGVRLLLAHHHRQRRALGQWADGGGRQRHRLLSRAADARTRCGPAPSMPILTATFSSWSSAWRSRATAPACSSPSTASPTARSRASASGAATSCLRRIPALGGPGFKRFRPIVRENNGTLRRLTNAEIAKDPDYGDYSLEQSTISVEEFYDRMEDVMSPAPLDPVRALTETITSLEEQVNARVTSVENGRKYLAGGGRTVDMPDGASIFETTGAWEDFATPSRDLRLLIAIDVVRGVPDRVARRPERYAMPSGKSVADVKAELDGMLASELAARKFSYTRSDGSKWTLSLKDVLDRLAALEMAYNINDCAELRWGAPEGSDEAATCKRQAPAAQRAKMAAEYRPWFAERRRPPRG